MTTRTVRGSGSSALSLTGLAATQRSRLGRGAAVVTVAGAVLALSGCTPTDEGVVLEGADGQKYVVPDNAERPMYDSKEACIADVTEQIAVLERQGQQIVDTPEELCEPSSNYPGAGYAGLWLGPLLFAGSRWASPNVAGWATVPSRGFAAPGGRVQTDVVTPAPAGSTVGERAPLKSGFGGTGKSGFAESAGG